MGISLIFEIYSSIIIISFTAATQRQRSATSEKTKFYWKCIYPYLVIFFLFWRRGILLNSYFCRAHNCPEEGPIRGMIHQSAMAKPAGADPTLDLSWTFPLYLYIKPLQKPNKIDWISFSLGNANHSSNFRVYWHFLAKKECIHIFLMCIMFTGKFKKVH